MKQLLLARFAMVRRSLEEALERITDDRLPYAPRAGMPTIRDILFEIAGTEAQILTYIQLGKRIPLREVVGPWSGIHTAAGVRELLDRTRAETIAFLDGLGDSDLESTRRFPLDWSESLGLPEVPLREGLISLAAHESYHTGQLVSYLWTAGEDPIAW